MKVIIIAPGTYNDDHGRPVRCLKGDVLTTASGYGQTLLDEGFARPALGQPAEPPTEPDTAAAPKIKRKKAAN
jgi:hypothetical protein